MVVSSIAIAVKITISRMKRKLGIILVSMTVRIKVVMERRARVSHLESKVSESGKSES